MRLGVIADPHVSVSRFDPASWHNPYRLTDSLERFARALSHPLVDDADAVAVLGDIVHWGDRESLVAAVGASTGRGRPVLFISGNHDVLVDGVRVAPIVDDTDDAFVGNALSERGIAPFADLVDRARMQLVTHDVVSEVAHRRLPFDVAERSASSGGNDHGATLLLTHFPVASTERRARGAGLLYAGHLAQLAPHSFAPTEPTIALSGHLHLRGVAVEGPLLQIVFAALIEAPYDVAAVDISCTSSSDVTVRYECASLHDVTETHVPVIDPPSGAFRWDGTRWRAASTPTPDGGPVRRAVVDHSGDRHFRRS